MRAPIARRRAEVERRAGDAGQLAGRDQALHDRRVAVGVDLHHVAVDGADALAGEVEVGVLRDVDRRRLVGLRVVVDDQRVGVGERVGHRQLQRAGVALVAVLAGQRELQRGAVGALDRRRRPHQLVEALEPAVQRVDAVVGGELVGLAVERERRAADAIAVAADDGAEVRRVLHVVLDAVVAEDDVAERAGLVRHLQRHDDGAVVGDPHLDAVRVGQRVEIDGGAVGEGAEAALGHGRLRQRPARPAARARPAVSRSRPAPWVGRR